MKSFVTIVAIYLMAKQARQGGTLSMIFMIAVVGKY
jgi:hypothetical protein